MRFRRTFQLILCVSVSMMLGGIADGQQRSETQAQRGGVNFATLMARQDKDKNGKLSRDEFRGPKQFFDRMDADGDGSLTVDEIKQAAAKYRGQFAQRPNTPQQTRRGPQVPDGVKAHRDIEYAKIGEESLRLDLYVPEKSDTKPPLLVWIHGGGWRKGSKEGVNPSFIRLTAEGYAAASINYRLNGLQAHPEHTHDCKGAIRWLRANADKYGYDVSRIGVGGGSAGGHLVLMLGMTAGVKELEGDIGGNLDQDSRVHAVVDLYGPSEFPLFAKNSERFRARYDDANELWKSASPLTYLTQDDAPVLIFQGDKDVTVPMSQSEILHERYQKAGLDSSLHIIKGAAHGGPQFSDLERYKLVKDFLDKQIKQAN
jgi:acetyl esterase/lipase